MSDNKHTHTYDTYPDRDDVTHDHKAGGPHIHDGLQDDAYIKAVADREKKAKSNSKKK
jgi:hypothetical protein